MNTDEMIMAADTAQMQSGGASTFEKLADNTTALVAGATVSALASFYNTGVAAVNVFGADAEEMSVANTLGDMNSNWQRYYEEHPTVVDTVGFIGGSFAPGTIALKGMQLAKKGKLFGSFVGGKLSYSSAMEAKYLEKGLQEIAQEGGTVFSRINANKLIGMGYGALDSAIDQAVMGTLIAATMHKSPLLADESWGDIAVDTMKWSLVGGALTGVLRILPVNRMYKDAGRLVDGTQRKYDIIGRSDKVALDVGDKTIDLINQVLTLPKEVLAQDRLLNFPMRTGGETRNISLNTGALYDKKLADTTHKAIQTITKDLTNIVAADTSVGSALSKSIVDLVQQGMVAGADVPTIRKKIYEQLAGLKGAEGIGAAPRYFSADVAYLSPGATLKAGDKIQNLLGSTRTSPTDVGYRIIGDLADARASVIGTEFRNARSAFDAGVDIAIEGKSGKFIINPESRVFQRVGVGEDVQALRSVYNVRTHAVTDNAMPTIADMATAEKALDRSAFGVSAGKYKYQMSLTSFNPGASSIETSARHYWAAQLDSIKQVTIHHQDFSLLSALAANPKIAGNGILIRMQDNTLIPFEEIKPKLSSWLLEQKVDYALQTQAAITKAAQTLKEAARSGAEITPAMRKAAAELDPRELALRVNSELSWIEKLIPAQYDPAKLRTEDAVRPLASYGEREQIVMVYDNAVKEAMKNGTFVDAELGHAYRMQVAKQKGMEASTAVLGQDADELMDLTEAGTRLEFDSAGVGASSLAASNANYGDLGRLWAQFTGAVSAKIMGKRADKVLQNIQVPAAEIIADKLAGAELGAVVTRIRRTTAPMTLLDGKLVDLKSAEEYLAAIKAGNQQAANSVKFHVNVELSPKVRAFLESHHAEHQRQFDQNTLLMNAMGVTHTWPREALYVPPIDTKKIPYFALVRQNEKAAFAQSNVGMITARTPQELDALIAGVPDGFQVIKKADNELFHKAMGDFDQGRTMNAPTTDPFQGKAGKLGDFMPTLEPKAVIEDFVNYHVRKEQQLTRDAIEVRYGETFNKLRWLSEANTSSQKSKWEYIGKQSAKTITDPYGDYAKTALNISKKAEYTLWHEANEFVDALGTRAYRAIEKMYGEAREGKLTWEEANRAMNKFGMDGPFTLENFAATQVGRDRQIIARAVRMGNMVLSVAGLGLDMANSLINIISTPILLGTEVSAIRSAMRGSDALNGKLNELLSVMDPASKVAVPSTTKLIGRAVKAYWGPDSEALLQRFRDIGAVSTIMEQHKSLIADLTITPNLAGHVWAKKVGDAVEKGTHWSGNKFAEQFTRFTSAHVMKEMTDPLVQAGRMGIKEQNAYISVFVNRVQGNYIASQRPIMFQGTLGAALGLFQTYQFNLFQQLFRHIENRDARALAVLGGMQSAIFGLNGLPLFNAINTHLIGTARMNEGHKDAYTFAVEAGEATLGGSTGGHAAADWLMYGTASAFPIFSDKAPALYSRGDINPRHVTIIPTSPTEVPVYQVGSRVIANLANMAKQIGGGGDVLPSLLEGLEHNGISRPLAGMAQVVQGFATTSRSSLISAASDFSAVATLSRIAGAKPMDEAVLLDTKFRLEAYRAADRDRIENLGMAVKQRIRSDTLTPEAVNDFQASYAASGGRIQNFGAAMQRWTKNATESVVNAVGDSQRTSYGRSMNIIMGDTRLDDFTTPPPESDSSL